MKFDDEHARLRSSEPGKKTPESAADQFIAQCAKPDFYERSSLYTGRARTVGSFFMCQPRLGSLTVTGQLWFVSQLFDLREGTKVEQPNFVFACLLIHGLHAMPTLLLNFHSGESVAVSAGSCTLGRSELPVGNGMFVWCI